MTQQQSRRLAELREALDRIDDTILSLIEDRLAAARAIAQAKDDEGDQRLKLRPRRQAEIVTRLTARAERAQPELIARVWREIMAHSLQAQAPTEIVLAPCDTPELLEARARAHFGSAAPIRFAISAAQALKAALEGEAIAVLQQPDSGDDHLRLFDVILGEDRQPLGYAIGRVAAEDALPAAAPERPARVRVASHAAPSGWTPASWREHPAEQQPAYPDTGALQRVERRLAGSAPLVEVADIIHLRAALAGVAGGRGFIVQGGDCAESFAEFNAEKVRTTYRLLLRMGARMRAAGGDEIVHLARIAGQFAKPRSAGEETVGGVTLPSYRGDAVNGPAFTPASRTPDPRRLLDAHRQAQVTIELLHAYASASYADLADLQAETGLGGPLRPVSMFTSHEALLLPYEQALTRFDAPSESWWATSGHMLWIGDRTRQLDGAHVEYCRGIANPVGLKCGPSLGSDELLRLIDRLDPDNRAGRLVLIGRFGAGQVAEHLPPLMRATRRAGRHCVWTIDPMHGNTRTVGTRKTRLVSDILSEIRDFFAISRAEGVHPGGMHLEMTGGDVTECLGGSASLAAEDLERRYLTHCDPRLNAGQALDVAEAVAALLGRTDPTSRSDAA